MAKNESRAIDLATYVIKTIINPMKEAEERRLNRTLTDLNTKNKVKGKHSHDGFIYEGEFYMPAISGRQIPNMNQQKATLDPAFHADMAEYLADKSATKTDIQMVQQVIFLLISKQTNWQDVRDALPDLFSEICPEIRALSRMRPEAFPLQDNPRHMRQFEAMKERMAIYLVSRLMY